MLTKKNITISYLLVTVAYANDVNINNNSFRATYENITLAENESMGLLGINYLNHSDNFYYGMGFYGSLKGKRGGFFSGGLELGYQSPLLGNVQFDIGGYAGGGSGNSKELFGNGLMLRTHAGLLYDFTNYQLGVALSNVQFPESDTNSNQISFQFDFPFQTIDTDMVSSQKIHKSLVTHSTSSKINYVWRDHYFSATYQQYFPTSKARNKNGQKLTETIGLIGAEYGYYFNHNSFFFLEASEALSGGVAGYAEVLGGLGYDYWLINSKFGLKSKMSVGSGGGAGVDVDGGLMYKLNLGVYYTPIKALTFSAEVGYINAPDGDFSALSTKFSILYNIKFLSVGGSESTVDTYHDTTSQLWRMRFGVEHYTASSTIRTNGDDSAADLAVFKFDRFINNNLYITGQGFGAYNGGISGYGGGLLGLGYQTSPFIGRLSAYGELLIGTGGAGGTNTGDGALVHPVIGLNYDISKTVGFQIGIGQVKGLSKDAIDTSIIDAGFVYKFRTIEP